MDNRFLLRQRQTWFVVVEVPPSLRPKLGRRVKRTLRTRDVNVARAVRWHVVAEIKASIEAARQPAPGNTLEQEALGYREALAEVTRRADADNDHGSPFYEGPVELLRSAVADRAEQIERELGYSAATGFNGLATGTLTPLALYVDRWVSEGVLKGGPLRPRTTLERRRAVAKLEAWLPTINVPATVEGVTHRVAGRYLSEVLLPSGRANITLAKAVNSLSLYWAWLIRRGHLPDDARNPWAKQLGSRGAQDAAGPEAERGFTDAELTALFAAPPDATMADFMRVAALTGMRREEIGRLTVADCAGGVFVVQSGKTEAAARRVPIHPDLAELVSRRAAEAVSTAFLFADLRSKNSERTDPVGKRFTTYRRGLGIQEGEGRRSKVNFHSFRRRFITEAINAGRMPHMVSLVVGHKEGRKGMTLGRYWGGADDAALRTVVESVQLPTLPRGEDAADDGAGCGS